MKTRLEILAWCSLNLTTLNYLLLTKEDIDKLAVYINTDGCTGVSNVYFPACVVHDFWYVSHYDFDGTKITQKEADYRFRKKMQALSPLGVFSPMSWWRWIGVRTFGKKFWDT